MDRNGKFALPKDATVLVLPIALGFMWYSTSSKSRLQAFANLVCDFRSLKGLLRWALLPSPGIEDTKAYNTGNHRHITELHERYGDSFYVLRNGKRVLYVRAPGAVRNVLMSEGFGKVWETEGAGEGLKSAVGSYVHNLVQPLLADRVFSNKGSKNGDARSMLQKTFVGSPVFVRGFAKEIDGELKTWQTNELVDALALSHDLIRSALYHAIVGDFTESLHTITPAFHEALTHFVKRYTESCHDPSLTQKDEEMLKLLGRSSEDVVAAFRAYREARVVETSDEENASAAAKASAKANDTCMLALMLDAGCTNEQAAAVIVNTIIAGAEAPASALAHTLQELGRNPQIQERLRSEIDRVVGANGAPWRHLDALPYTKSVVLEGLRLFAPATLVKRQALADVDVDGVGRVPKGTVVELCVTAVHADPKQYPEPMVFKPEREGPVVGAILGKERCFLPFSGGPRGCPGRYLAVTMLHVAMASILQRYEIASVPTAAEFSTATGVADEAERVRKFALWPKDGLPIMLRKSPVTA
eukprot:TRINITY_DN3021_c0_g1_i4.p1 TRINITY_DN3021_c0_g1~~TRINITY_DN3021_c0_g1_i4.p1  ORF type:complete len:530 (-),score=125.83 TRINITY_DN3021_c0_g1_i4:514-2103(-)